MSKKAIVYFAIVGALAALAIAFPVVILLGLIFFVVPGAVLAIAPSLFVYSLIAYVVWVSLDTLRSPLRLGIVLASWAAFAVLPPLYYNQAGQRVRAELTAGDVTFSGAPLRGDTIAILTLDRKLGTQKDQSACDAICLRLLYNGTAKRVVREDRSITPATTGLRAFRIERRESCPPAGQLDDASMPGEPAAFWDRPADRFRLRIASGECLIAETADAWQIDAMVIEQTVRPKLETGFSRPWDLKLDSVSARRVEATQREGKEMRTRLRQTEVASEPLFIPFVIGPVSGHGLELKSGFLRRPVTVNHFNFDDVAIEIFGSGAKLPDRPLDGPAETRLLISALRNPDLPASDPKLQLADQVLKQISQRGASGPDDITAVRLIIEDLRITTLFQLAGAVSKLGPESASLAGPLLDRLMAAPWPEGRDIVQSTSRALYRLPQGALTPVMDKLIVLSQLPGRRGAAYLAVSRLGDLGETAVPKFLALLNPPKLQAEDDPLNNELQVEIGALIGLCRLAPKDAATQEKLADIVRKSPAYSDRGRLAVEALVRGGAKEIAQAAAEGNPDRVKSVEREIQLAENPRNTRLCES
jgi:hypothetical protein